MHLGSSINGCGFFHFVSFSSVAQLVVDPELLLRKSSAPTIVNHWVH